MQSAKSFPSSTLTLVKIPTLTDPKDTIFLFPIFGNHCLLRKKALRRSINCNAHLRSFNIVAELTMGAAMQFCHDEIAIN